MDQFIQCVEDNHRQSLMKEFVMVLSTVMIRLTKKIVQLVSNVRTQLASFYNGYLKGADSGADPGFLVTGLSCGKTRLLRHACGRSSAHSSRKDNSLLFKNNGQARISHAHFAKLSVWRQSRKGKKEGGDKGVWGETQEKPLSHFLLVFVGAPLSSAISLPFP